MPVEYGKRNAFQLEELGRSSSPFDHQASFIPFASVPEEINNSIRQYSPEGDHSVSAAEPPILVGHKYLADCMGYRMDFVSLPASRLICADALTYLEKLTSGGPLTRRPRSMLSADVQKRLLRMIPAPYLRLHRVSIEQPSVRRATHANDNLAFAIGKYIRDLEIEKDSKAKKEKRGAVDKKSEEMIRAQVLPEHSERVVEKALDKIELWCNDWLAGNVLEVDWNKMGTICED